MPTFLEKIGLQTSFTCELDIQQEDFVSRLKKQVDKGDLGVLFDTFDIFSSSKNEYKGTITSKGFEIRRKAKLFSNGSNMAEAKGTFVQQDQRLLIHTTIDGLHPMMFFFLFFVVVMYAVVFSFANLGGAIFFFILHGLLMISIPYFIMRRGTKSLKRELEREFYFVAKN
ncbi:MAG: uncharacterized protein JWM14_3132 [Chitinophagaceae bacterium]|nr:uncharacterized protein [Chitinophagaceae bacterium]